MAHWHEKVWKPALALSAFLMLLTIGLAVYYAPVPATSVRNADDFSESIQGTEVTVAGLIAGIESWGGSDAIGIPTHYNVTLADFSDYSRYLGAVGSGDLYGDWWTIEPVGAVITVGGLSNHGPFVQLSQGMNVSITGVLEVGTVRPISNATGLVLICDNGNDVAVIGSPASISVVTAPLAQKIFYFHMPSAWVSYLGFSITLVFSILYLRKRTRMYDRIAFSSAELGVLFATIAIVTGPIWAKQEWGVYWRWDDTKLITTFVMWLVYIGYLMLRAAMVESGTRARVSAVYGILGFVTMPMSLLSARIAPLIRSSHPEVIASSTGSLSQEAGITVGIAVVAFTLLFITMLIKRVEIEESEEELEELKRRAGGEE